MVIARKFLLAKHFNGPPNVDDFKIIEEDLPDIKDGEFLAEAVYLSVDPYMRAYSHRMTEGSPMVGSQVAKIIESKNEDFPVGKYIAANFDWQTHTISSTDGVGTPYLLPDLEELPLSYGLSVLGMPGNTAYFSFLDICKPKAGETVIISGAAGAVGIIVGQVAKMQSCRVIGITGSDDKGQYIVENFGFDGYVNYKRENLEEQLKQAAPEGIDCYYDNVAGEISTTVIKQMNTFGRICICGSISSYNTDINNPPKVSCVQLHMLRKQLLMQGFQSIPYRNRIFESINQHLEWIREGKLKYIETITEGFENMPKAFIEMLEGKNLGKAVVKV
ncbi:hypothetical protein RI129_002338 [Pyrocoelia pectoralis]|uniref:Prostaglandin reductase 1 n=1 Tax=Pyrocoelia pectoralis TaxID=417401 RepID=A0AAN7VLP8_9COLE